jgi:hypothetical protein
MQIKWHTIWIYKSWFYWIVAWVNIPSTLRVTLLISVSVTKTFVAGCDVGSFVVWLPLMLGGWTEPPPPLEPPPLVIFLAPLIPAALIEAILIPALIFVKAFDFANCAAPAAPNVEAFNGFNDAVNEFALNSLLAFIITPAIAAPFSIANAVNAKSPVVDGTAVMEEAMFLTLPQEIRKLKDNEFYKN